MTALACLALAIIALVRVVRVERELALLRRRLDASDARQWPLAGAGETGVPRPPAAAGGMAAPSPDIAVATASPATPGPEPLPLPATVTPEPATAAVPAAAPAPPPHVRVAPPPPLRLDRESLERAIGGKLLLYAGMVLVVLAAGFFLRYAFEHDWLSPAVRVALGLLAGLAFAAGGQRLALRGYTQYGLFLSGGGFALLFLSVYSAYGIYGLIGQGPAFLLLVVVAAAAAVVADRNQSLPLALMAVCGGFAAPFLVSSGADAQLTLFTYDAVLIAATMYLAARRGWPSLNLASFVWTLFTVTAWMIDRYTSARYLSTELFLTLYCAMFVAILRENLRSTWPNASAVSVVLAFAPLLYHAASTAILFDHGVAFLIYASLISAAVVVASLESGVAVLRFLGWLVMTAALGVWVASHQSPPWLTGSTVVAIGTWVIFLAPALRAAIRREAIDPWDMRLIHSAGLTAFALVYLAFKDVAGNRALASMAAAFAVANVACWAALRRRSDDAVHWLGVGFTLCAVAVAIGFEGFWTVVMWASEALALTFIGVRANRFWFRVGGFVLFAIALGVWLQSAAMAPADGFVVLINARALSGLFIVATLYASGAVQKTGGADTRLVVERAIALVAAHALTVGIISLEIVSFWDVHEAASVDPELARELMLSTAWAIYAGTLIAIGMQRHYPPIRYFAMALFGLTVLKVIAVDSQALDGIYRVIAFLVVGATLLLVAFLYQRGRGAANPDVGEERSELS